jgi:hypothetical protein
LVDDEVAAIGAAEVDGGLGLSSGVSGSNDTVGAEESGTRAGEAEKSANFAGELGGGLVGWVE